MRSLRRVFLPADYAGGDTKYWEAQWLEELRPFGGITARLLQAHLHSPSLLLEAGCGQGEVAVGLAALGHAVIGVDLASEALTDCRRRHPDLPLVVGDVGRLPFRDGAFDAITSLGVVEHFEAGPITILQEHRRVATDNAILLVTVPARGWYRKWSDLLNLRLKRAQLYEQRGRWIGLRSRPHLESSVKVRFHQYEFPRRMIQRMARAAGLEVESWQPFGVAWALGDSPLLTRLISRLAIRVQPVTGPAGSQLSSAGVTRRPRSAREYLHEPVIEETWSDPMQRSIAWAATHALAHMQLLAFRPAQKLVPQASHAATPSRPDPRQC
jgi:SAM-dependent methyltransferase